jgi:hypothetical protein
MSADELRRVITPEFVQRVLLETLIEFAAYQNDATALRALMKYWPRVDWPNELAALKVRAFVPPIAPLQLTWRAE